MSFQDADFKFANKRVLVTGAARGIGRALVAALVKYGAHVVALSRNGDSLIKLKEEYPQIDITVCDVAADIDVIREALLKYHPFDCVVNNAGIAEIEEFLSLSPEKFDRMYAVNVRGPVLISQICAKEMIKNSKAGSIVNISSQASKRPIHAHTGYCISKAALDMATRCMAKELGVHQIRVNTVNPTVVMTDMGRAIWSEPTKASNMLQQIPLGRFATTDDVIGAVIFLLSDLSSMVTGESIAVDGGWSYT